MRWKEDHKISEANQRMSEEIQGLKEESQKLCKIVSKLKAKNQTLGQTNLKFTEKFDKWKKKFSSICCDFMPRFAIPRGGPSR